jgi:hypothetical protein
VLTVEQAIVIREWQERGYRFDASLHGTDDVTTDDDGQLVMNYHVTMRDPSGHVVLRRDGPEIWPTVWRCIEELDEGERP